MITVEVVELGESSLYKEIYYRDSDDICIRHITLDKDDNIVLDEMTEFTSDKRVKCSVIYGRECTNVLSYREYQYGSNGAEIGYCDYKNINGRLKMISRVERFSLEEGKSIKAIFYDGLNNPIGYELFSFDERYGMTIDGRYNMSGEKFFFNNDSYAVGLLP